MNENASWLSSIFASTTSDDPSPKELKILTTQFTMSLLDVSYCGTKIPSISTFLYFNLNNYMTSEAAVMIAVVVLLSLFVTVAVAVVSFADFDLYKAF